MFKILKNSVILFLTLLSSVVFAQNQNLANPISSSGKIPQITTDNTGMYLYAIWEDGATNAVITAFSDDFGVTWKNPTTTPAGTPKLTNLGFKPQISNNSYDIYNPYICAVWQTNNATSGLIQIAYSTDFGKTWQYPTTTPIGTTTPTIANAGFNPQIANDSYCQHIYAVWQTAATAAGTIQTAYSTDFGKTWQYPTSTPGTTNPDLADSGFNPQIANNFDGTYVSAVWQASDSSAGPIQTAYSTDFGKIWQYPTSTPGTTTPDLADSGSNPQITTNVSGGNIYAIWIQGSTNAVQTAYSKDCGQTWQYPTSTPGTTIPDLADSGTNPQIITDYSGRYIFAIWVEVSTDDIQTAYSKDFGLTWQYPTSTPIGTTTPNLANKGFNPQITIDSYGRYIYAVWETDDAVASPIQTAYSKDFGLTWHYPTSTPVGSPDLTNTGFKPQVITGDYGRYIYTIWSANSPGAIQAVLSKDFGLTWQDSNQTVEN